MEIIMFLVGFLSGSIVVALCAFALQKYSKTINNELFNQMKLEFENTANKIFKENSTEFSTQNKEKLEDFFLKFKEKIESFEKRTEQNFKDETENFTRFDMNIKNFIETGNRISTDTNSLVSVMKSDNRTQGHWGEIVLERVLECSNLRRDEEYLIQKGTTEGRPDAIVLLPQERCVMIDAKTSFASWYAYLEADNEDEKALHLKKFKDSTKTHIQGLTKREYREFENKTTF